MYAQNNHSLFTRTEIRILKFVHLKTLWEQLKNQNIF